MPVSVREVEYFRQLSTNYDPKLARKKSADLMEYMNGELRGGHFAPDVMEYCMTVLASITLRCFRLNDVESQCQLLDGNVCESIKTVLDTMGAENKVVARKGCEAVRNMAWGSTDFCDVIVDAKLGTTLCAMVAAHGHDTEVMRFAITSLAFLCFGNMDHAYSLAECGALEAVGKVRLQAARQAHGTEKEEAEEALFETVVAACYAAKSLALAGFALKVLHSGCIEVAVYYLEQHIAIKGPLREAAIYALSAICSLNSACRERVGDTAAPRLVSEALSVDSSDPDRLSPAELLNCCEAILHLSLNTNVSEELSKHRAPAQLLDVLDSTLLGEEHGAEICTGALLNLTRYGSTAAACRSFLADAAPRSVHVMDRVRQTGTTGFRAREIAKTLLKVIADEVDIRREHIVPPHVLMGIVNASEPTSACTPLLAELRIFNDGSLASTSGEGGHHQHSFSRSASHQVLL